MLGSNSNNIKFLGGFLLIAICSLFSRAQSVATPEYQLKAVFLYNFTQFVEWPSSSFLSPDDPFVIGILGENDFETYILKIVYGDSIGGHPILIQKYNTYNDVKKCHILFIGENKTKQLNQMIGSLKKQNVLIVGDDSAILSQGGMIRIFAKDKRMHLQICMENVDDTKLILSSKLMRLAEFYVK